MGGLVIGQEVARQAKARYLFAEKENNVLVMRRGFTLAPGEPVLVVEDVVTRGGRVNECLEIIRKAGGAVAGVAMLVDRSAGSAGSTCRPCRSWSSASRPTPPTRRARGPGKAPGREAGELSRMAGASALR
jgi:orotate phosphoribosyltransferase